MKMDIRFANVPDEEASDLKRLFDNLFSCAHDMLRVDSTVIPTGFLMRKDQTFDGPHVFVDASDVSGLVAQFAREVCARSEQAALAAAGLFLSALAHSDETGKRFRAIYLILEHSSGHCVHVRIPYRKILFRWIRYGKPEMFSMRCTLFPASDG